MRWLLPLASAFVAEDLRGALRRARRTACIWAAVAVLAVTTYAFLLVAAYQRLGLDRPADEAALIVAAAAFGTGVVAVGIGLALAAAEKRRSARRRAAAKAEMAVALSALPLLLRSRPLLIAAAIGAIAFLGSQPRNTGKD